MEMQGDVEAILASPVKNKAGETKRWNRAKQAFQAYLDRVRSVRVIDPACESGNFLYVALHEVKTLERDAILWGSLRLQTTNNEKELLDLRRSSSESKLEEGMSRLPQ